MCAALEITEKWIEQLYIGIVVFMIQINRASTHLELIVFEFSLKIFHFNTFISDQFESNFGSKHNETFWLGLLSYFSSYKFISMKNTLFDIGYSKMSFSFFRVSKRTRVSFLINY